MLNQIKISCIYFPVVLALLYPLSQNAQTQFLQNKTSVYGRIIDLLTRKGIENVSVVINTTYQGTVSRQNGFFEVYVDIDDKLEFICLGYARINVVVTQSMLKGDSILLIEMRKIAYDLPKVTIYPHYTYKDLLTMKVDTPQFNFMLPMKDAENSSTVPSSGGMSPVTALYNLFSKRQKSIDKYYKLLEEDKIREPAIERFHANVKKITNLSDKPLYDFIQYCNFPDSLIIRSNEYDLLIAIKQIYAKYRQEHPNQPDSLKSEWQRVFRYSYH